ncbi:MAG: phenylalanyl-tRNA synthetase beta chain [Candidatus Peregrinibacteria bacterium Gr01-1014_25]|nr:MAG: phenylalanyl-tRNA synthetase beta chain [Candidatus Peregrinibacteria bacterium Gr01-1014_25]
MKISLDWLADFIEWTERDPAVIAERLTVCSAEVEEVEEQGALLAHCCVGKVVKTARHPNADKLSLVDVATDHGTKRVVCGGSNVREGMLVAFAHVGATVRWHGGDRMTLERATIRGEESEGMICAAEELDLGGMFPPSPEDGPRPIIDLMPMAQSAKLKVGMPLREALGMTDTILHVSNKAIPHRPDLFSHIGFARECVALGLARWKKPRAPKLPFPKTPCPVRCRIDVPDLVPRYVSCLLTIDVLGTTPDWMRRRLEATGWRSVSLPVDITNYVTMELGMPLHSFDADDLVGDVCMRTSTKGERLTTLDGADRTLPDGAIVLSDNEGIFDLLGIMGGLRSSTKETTRRIYLHSAIIDPVRIRRTIIATGHRTDASTVYEKGVPRIMAKAGLLRAAELFLATVPGCKLASRIDEEGDDGRAPSIPLRPDHVRDVLGVRIPDKRMIDALSDLGCIVKHSGKQKHGPHSKLKAQSPKLAVFPPLWRLRDLTAEHDLIEEIGRITGFDAITPVLPAAPVLLHARDERSSALRRMAKERGFCELLPLSLVGPSLVRKAGMDPSTCVALANPLGEEFSLLAPGHLPRLLEHASRAVRQTAHDVKTFTVGRIFSLPRNEERRCALLLVARDAADLSRPPLLRLQADIAACMEDIGVPLMVQPAECIPPSAHPGQAASLMSAGTNVGLLCTLHPDVCERFGLPPSTAFASLSVDALLRSPQRDALLRDLPMFPAIVYDETFPRTHAKRIGPLLEELRRRHALLTDVDITDLYVSAALPRDQYNVTLRFTYRAPDRTLTEEEAKEVHEEVIAAISEK